MDQIDCFEGKYAFLSNFYMCDVEYGGVLFPSVEHAYQAAKTVDLNLRKSIAALPTPGKAKRAGKALTLRKDWEKIKIPIMDCLVREKFAKHDDLCKQLIDTKDSVLIEKNWWDDKFWGVCDGEGENNLGLILMKIRDELKKQLIKIE